MKKKVYDPNNPSVVTEETIFVYSSNKLVAEYSTKPPPPDPTTSYTATDMLGSPRVITNALGEVTSRRDFMPFGEQVYSEPTFRPTSLKYNTGDDVRQKFTGYEKDEETQLDFAEARMYQNKHGRFTAVDPLLASGKSADPQTFNRYVYVLNNPLMLTDPDGLQVATEGGKVYSRGNGFYIFSGKGTVPDAYKPVRKTIETTTTIKGVMYHLTVRPNGWEVGDRVDNVKFSTASPTAAPQGNSRIRDLVLGFNRGFDDSISGAEKGAKNFGINTVNLVTDTATGGTWRSLAGYDNPLAIERYSYNSLTEAKFGLGTEAGLTLGTLRAGNVFAGSRAGVSVVPESSLTRFPPIKSGSAGGPTAGERFPTSVRNQAFDENPERICVFCRQPNATQVDHAVARSQGGNATIDNAQLTCRFCNPSKGTGSLPKNPAPGYTGPFPPPWW